MTGKTAVVLGASAEGGIGWATASAFAAAGARVVIAARRVEPLQALAARIDATAVVCDGAREAHIKALAGRVAQVHGTIDYAVNCAGLTTAGSIADASTEELEVSLGTNYIGNVLFTRYMAEIMNDGGAITLISSTAVDRPMPSVFAYASAKAATECMMRYAALEYGPRGIRVNAVIPGLIATELTSYLTEMKGMVKAFEREVPLGRIGVPTDISEVILWLSASRYITGVSVPVSGGNQLTRMPRMDEMGAV